jgi:type IV pilus assembly protein PilE
MVKQQGLGMIELMVTVVIVGILAVIAYPNYKKYRIETNRQDVQAELLRIATELQKIRVVDHSYQHASLTKAKASATYPSNDALYTIALTLDADKLGYVLVATPINSKLQAGDGIMCLNHLGQRYWAKAATTCQLSSTSAW